MDESVGAQIKISLSHLDGLIQRGRQLCETLSANPSNASAIAATRAWQEDCGITVNQLSGGSKAHWLARSFSEAFLMRSASGSAVEAALPAEIVQRLIAVLEHGVDSLTGIDHTSGANGQSRAVPQAPPPRRFEFVHNPELRPVVEQAFTDSRRALRATGLQYRDADFLRNSGGHRHRRAGTQGTECTRCLRRTCREDFQLVVRDEAHRRGEGRTDSRRMRPPASNRTSVSRSTRSWQSQRYKYQPNGARCAARRTGSACHYERSGSRPLEWKLSQTDK